MIIDAGKLVQDILEALGEELGEDLGTIRDFAERQSGLLARQAAFIAEARATGSLRDDDDLFAFFVEQLEDKAATFARAMATLTLLTLEKAWNAIVRTLWDTINGALAVAGLPQIIVPGPPVTTI